MNIELTRTTMNDSKIAIARTCIIIHGHPGFVFIIPSGSTHNGWQPCYSVIIRTEYLNGVRKIKGKRGQIDSSRRVISRKNRITGIAQCMVGQGAAISKCGTSIGRIGKAGK